MPGHARSALVRLCAGLALLMTLWAAPVAAQQLPIPGLPGGLGGIGTPAPETAPEPDSGDGSAAPGAAATAPANDPTRALIDILRDETAREALIRELERAATGETPPPAPAPNTPPNGASPEAPAAPAEAPASAPALTFGERAVASTRALGGWVADELESAWLRIKRVPTTLTLSLRAFEGDVLARAVAQAGIAALFLYAALGVLRLGLAPLRRRLGRAAQGATWFRRLTLRVAVSLLMILTIPLAIFIGIFAMLLLGLAASTADGRGAEISDVQALFVNAFAAVEAALVVLRFLLSPKSPDLRMITLPERGVRGLWFAGRALSYAIGYGQLFLVPVISSEISVFVGRASAAVISAVAVGALILWVLSRRRGVADWLRGPPDENGAINALRDALARRWHLPVLAYLLYVFVTVLTRPGNVLIPLLVTTGEAVLAVFLGGLVFGALSAAADRRLRMPGVVGERLPLLEERVNQIFPAFLRTVRLLLVIALAAVILDILGLQTVGGLLTSNFFERVSAGLFSVLLIATLLSLVWLAMTSWVDFRLNPFIGKVPTPREITLLTLMKNAVTVALVLIGIISSLAQLGMNVGPLLASAGVIGLAISFGAQRMVEDIFSGIFIQAENAMNVGDVVDVGGTVGTVEKLTVRSVTLRDLSGVVHVIPFSSAAKISNYMRDFSYHLADIGVAYREDVEDVRQAMHDAFDELRRDEEAGPHVIGDLEWFGLNAFGASELVMRARIKTTPGDQWGIGRAYNAIVKRLFDERGIEIPFPHQTLYFGEDKSGRAPPLHLKVERRAATGRAAAQSQAEAPAAHRPPPAEHGATISGQDMPASDEP